MLVNCSPKSCIPTRSELYKELECEYIGDGGNLIFLVVLDDFSVDHGDGLIEPQGQ